KMCELTRKRWRGPNSKKKETQGSRFAFIRSSKDDGRANDRTHLQRQERHGRLRKRTQRETDQRSSRIFEKHCQKVVAHDDQRSIGKGAGISGSSGFACGGHRRGRPVSPGAV